MNIPVHLWWVVPVILALCGLISREDDGIAIGCGAALCMLIGAGLFYYGMQP